MSKLENELGKGVRKEKKEINEGERKGGGGGGGSG